MHVFRACLLMIILRGRNFCYMYVYHPSPWIEVVGVLIVVFIEMNGSEIGEDTPVFGYKMPFDLDIYYCFANDAYDNVAHPQSFCYNLLRRKNKLFNMFLGHVLVDIYIYKLQIIDQAAHKMILLLTFWVNGKEIM